MANSVDPDQTALRSSLIWVYTVWPDMSVRKVRIIMVQTRKYKKNVSDKYDVTTMPFDRIEFPLVKDRSIWASSWENASSGFSDQVRLKLACTATKASMRLEILVTETRDITLSRQRTTKALIRLRGCTGWSVPLLFAYDIRYIFSWPVSYKEQEDFSRWWNQDPQKYEHDKTNKMTCAPSKDWDQPGHLPSLNRDFAVRSMGS